MPIKSRHQRSFLREEVELRWVADHSARNERKNANVQATPPARGREVAPLLVRLFLFHRVPYFDHLSQA